MKIELIEWEDEDGHHCQVVHQLAHFTHYSEDVVQDAAAEYIRTMERTGKIMEESDE